jgi:DNA-binding transcriptional regulator LsrR (DeoR family)
MDPTDLTPDKPHPKRKKNSKDRTAPADASNGGGVPDQIELCSAVYHYLGIEKTVLRTKLAVERDFPTVKLTRQDIYRLLRLGRQREWIKFLPPAHLLYETMLKSNYPRLQDVAVAHTTIAGDVAYSAAKQLLRLVKQCHLKDRRAEIHIGFVPGHAMLALARAFAEVLCEAGNDLPKTIVFHALAAGFDPTDLSADPIAFFGNFADNPNLQVTAKFVGLHAPSLVNPASIDDLLTLPDIQAAFAAVRELDIIVASGTSWLHPHSTLRTLMQRTPECMRVLESEGAVGDYMWQPLSAKGPIVTETPVRALTLIRLSELPALIKHGKRVLLVLGPCGLCHAPKGVLLSCLLNQERPLLTDLVVDSRTVSEMIRDHNRAGGGH